MRTGTSHLTLTILYLPFDNQTWQGNRLDAYYVSIRMILVAISNIFPHCLQLDDPQLTTESRILLVVEVTIQH